MQVSLNVYDVTNTANDSTNNVITRLNSITRELALGGVFHGAIELDGLEWSFGYCETGTGVYACRARSNGMYTFRETIELGVTHKTKPEVKEILTRLKREWQGPSYDLLQRNCCHFCEELCCALGVPNPPAWLNRFAQGADATVKFTNEASAWLKRVSTSVSQTAQQNAQWLREMILTNQGAAGQTPGQAAAEAAADAAGAGPQLSSSAASDLRQDQGQGQAHNPLYARAQAHGSTSSSSTASKGGCPQAAETRSGLSRAESRSGPGLRPQAPEAPAPAAAPPLPPPATSSGAWRRLPLLAGAGAAAGVGSGAGGGAAAGGGLPVSTAASAPESPSRLASVRSAAQAQTARLASAVRQKLQELEASAGDGTKQFLFGLIKTRQSRPGYDDDDPPGPLPAHEGDGTFSTGAPAATAAAPSPPPLAPTQPPVPQVISHSLLPPDVLGADPIGPPGSVPDRPAASGASVGPSGPHLLDL